MRIARTIFALLLSLSVATLPMVGVVGATMSADMADMVGMESMHDCCPHKANPCHKAMDDCQSMATCALKCFSFAPMSFATIFFPLAPTGMRLPLASNPLYSQAAIPPFRPPRS